MCGLSLLDGTCCLIQAILIIKKNLFLAAESGLLITLYHKCLQGSFVLIEVWFLWRRCSW